MTTSHFFLKVPTLVTTFRPSVENFEWLNLRVSLLPLYRLRNFCLFLLVSGKYLGKKHTKRQTAKIYGICVGHTPKPKYFLLDNLDSIKVRNLVSNLTRVTSVIKYLILAFYTTTENHDLFDLCSVTCFRFLDLVSFDNRNYSKK